MWGKFICTCFSLSCICLHTSVLSFEPYFAHPLSDRHNVADYQELGKSILSECSLQPRRERHSPQSRLHSFMCIQEPGLRKEWALFGGGMGTSLVVALFLLLLGHQFGSSNIQALSHKCFNQCQDTAGSLAVLNPGEQFEGPQTPVSQYLINISSHEVNRASLILENRKKKKGCWGLICRHSPWSQPARSRPLAKALSTVRTIL